MRNSYAECSIQINFPEFYVSIKCHPNYSSRRTNCDCGRNSIISTHRFWSFWFDHLTIPHHHNVGQIHTCCVYSNICSVVIYHWKLIANGKRQYSRRKKIFIISTEFLLFFFFQFQTVLVVHWQMYLQKYSFKHAARSELKEEKKEIFHFERIKIHIRELLLFLVKFTLQNRDNF